MRVGLVFWQILWIGICCRSQVRRCLCKLTLTVMRHSQQDRVSDSLGRRRRRCFQEYYELRNSAFQITRLEKCQGQIKPKTWKCRGERKRLSVKRNSIFVVLLPSL